MTALQEYIEKYKQYLTQSFAIRIAMQEAEKELKGLRDQLNLDDLEAAVRKEALEAGKSIKEGPLAVTYVKGSARWDTKALDEKAKADPELAALKKESAPQVRLKWTDKEPTAEDLEF